MKTQNTQSSSRGMVYAGIDYHEIDSVAHLLDEEGAMLRQGRFDGKRPAGFAALLAGFPDTRAFPAGNLPFCGAGARQSTPISGPCHPDGIPPSGGTVPPLVWQRSVKDQSG